MWYLTRGAGLVALILLTASVAVGVLVKVEWRSPRWPRFVTLGLHRNLSLLALAAVVLHVATTVIDGYVPIGWIDAVVPFASPYRMFWLGLGAIAFDVFLVVVLTSLLRRRIPYGAWRAIHLTSWASWPVALVHGLGTGSDTTSGWALVLSLACALVVLGACWFRLAFTWRRRRPAQLVALAASIVVPVAVLAWLVTGPLQAGWSKRASEPPSATASTVVR